MLSGSVTIDQAKGWLRARLKDGADCPVCSQRVQLYRRKLNSGMVRALIQIYQAAGQGWVKVQDIPNGPKGGDYAKLRFWELLEARGDRSDDGNSAGVWRVTDLGLDFLFGSVKVPSHVGTYNNHVYPLHEPTDLIGIHEALGERFDYTELLDG